MSALHTRARPPSISVVVCAYNEASYLPGCLDSLLAQSRPPDELLVVDNASTDGTSDVALARGVRVVAEPRRGLVRARARGRDVSTGDVIAYVDADCRVPFEWLARLERRFTQGGESLAAVTGPYRYYDWNATGPLLIGTYDALVAPSVQFVVHRVLGLGSILYGGNFAVRRSALDRIGGFDSSIEFHGEDTNLGRRLAAIGRVELRRDCWVYTSARRFRAMGTRHVCALYLRNFLSELVLHRPRDTTHLDVRD